MLGAYILETHISPQRFWQHACPTFSECVSGTMLSLRKSNTGRARYLTSSCRVSSASELTTADLYGESKSSSSTSAFTWLSGQAHSRRRCWVTNPTWSTSLRQSKPSFGVRVLLGSVGLAARVRSLRQLGSFSSVRNSPDTAFEFGSIHISVIFMSFLSCLVQLL